MPADRNLDQPANNSAIAMPPQGRILLAEDHDINQMLVSEMLGRCGQRFELASDGEQAVEKALAASTQDQPFDLVLMDIQMPKFDGYEASRRIRRSLSGSELPIIALTANAFEDDRKAASIAGMQDHLTKPLAFAELAAMLTKWLPAVRPQRSPEIKSDDPPATRPKESLQERWQIRRAEALDAVSKLVREGDGGASDVEELARLVHKLAGTAGMFGEADLGDRAGELERALRDKGNRPGTRQVAQDLLDAA